MRRCINCLYPETVAWISFNEDGLCSACQQAEIKKKIDWNKREKLLQNILNEAKERTHNNWDCIIPSSFGKDSTFILYTLKRKYNMNPLVVTFNHMFFSEIGYQNMDNISKKLGLDCIMLSPNYNIVKKLAKKSTVLLGDTCWHCHAGIGAFPFQIAVKFKIPLMIWGEPPAEYGRGSYENIQIMDYNRYEKDFLKNIHQKDMIDDEIKINDLLPYVYPSVEEIKNVNVKGIYLGNYINWNWKKQVEIIQKELGWKSGDVEGSFDKTSNIECKYGGVHDYQCYLKRGYARSTRVASMHIRHNNMTREEAIKYLETEGKRPSSLDSLLKEIDMTEDEFINETKKHKVY